MPSHLIFFIGATESIALMNLFMKSECRNILQFSIWGIVSLPVCGEYAHTGRPVSIPTFGLLFSYLWETFRLGFFAVALVLVVFFKKYCVTVLWTHVL